MRSRRVMQIMLICKCNYVSLSIIKSFLLPYLIDNDSIMPYKKNNIIITTSECDTMDIDKERAQRLQKEGTLHPNPEKVHTDLLEKSPFFDANDLMQMKYEMLRSVSVDQRSITEAAHTFGLSRVAYYHAQEQYQQNGIAGLLPRRRGPKRPHKFTPAVVSFIEAQLAAADQRPDWHLLSKQIEDRFGIKTHPRSVERAVRQKKMVT